MHTYISTHFIHTSNIHTHVHTQTHTYNPISHHIRLVDIWIVLMLRQPGDAPIHTPPMMKTYDNK